MNVRSPVPDSGPFAADTGIVVLAGDRGPTDVIAQARQVTSKALAPVAGRVMLTRLLDALAPLETAGPVVIVAPDLPGFRAAAAASVLEPQRIRWVTPASSPSRSLARAFAAVADTQELLLVTADHPLLDAAWLRDVVSEARTRELDLAVALVAWERVSRRFPEGRRTRYRFRDIAVCGTNLFLFRSHRARAIVDVWRRVEADRKRPWRIVALLGWSNLVRYLLGRLTLAGALAQLSARLDMQIGAVLLEAPESAVDVDSIADLACVESVLEAREAAVEQD